jgi:hypothetical protein
MIHGMVSQAATYCGRLFSPEELSRVRAIIAEDRSRNRSAISRIACQELGWYKRDGGLKEMSCRVALLRMHRDGLIVLPNPQNKNANGVLKIRQTSATAPPATAINLCAAHLRRHLQLKLVDTKKLSRLWNEYVARYHYLGHAPLPGAQLRFLVYHGDTVLACLGFGAAAWSVASRDLFIGWTKEQRLRNLHLVVNNARFLILPWIISHNLASMILASVSKALPALWEARYGYRPVLLETFVETPRFHGTCYKAANWISVGITTGRGKLDIKHSHALSRKEVFLFPLCNNFRNAIANKV